MNVTIAELMVEDVETTTPHYTLGHVKQILRQHKGNCLPVVDSEGHAVGIVSATDFLHDHPDELQIGQLMTEKVYTVPAYADPSLAARIMRNHGIHHLVVTREQKVVGIISSFDLLRLVEDHRFVAKNAPGVSTKKHRGKRRTEEIKEPGS